MPVAKSTKKFFKKLLSKPYKKKNILVSKKAIRKTVAKTVKQLVESKEVRNSQANATLYSYPHTPTLPNNYASNNIFDTSLVYQGIGQGTGEGNRIGNVIHPSKFRFSFCMTARQGLSSPLIVRMYVLTYKFDPNNSTVNDVWACLQQAQPSPGSSFFDNGNSSNGMTGTLVDLLLPVNTDVMRIYKTATYKLSPAGVPQGAGGSNNDFKYFIRQTIDLLKYIPAQIKWNDNGTTSYNKKVYIVFEALSSDGTTITDTSSIINFSYSYHFQYKDA